MSMMQTPGCDAGTPVRPAGLVAPPSGFERLAAEERQNVLRQRVRLREHRGAGLLQDLAARQVGRFRREVRVLNPRTRGRKVLGSGLQVRDRGREAVLIRTERSA